MSSTAVCAGSEKARTAVEPTTPEAEADGGHLNNPGYHHADPAKRLAFVMLNVRMFHPHEWPLYRDLRLAALRDTPGAFGSTLAREEAFSDDEWLTRLTHGVASAQERPLVAEWDGRPAGLCWVRIDPADPDSALLYQVWVHPDARGRGVGEGMLAAATHWAREAGARTMTLTVSLTSATAMRLYRRAGFVEFGLPHPLRDGSALLQQAMELDLLTLRPATRGSIE